MRAVRTATATMANLVLLALLAGCSSQPAVTVTVAPGTSTQAAAGSATLKLWATDAQDDTAQFSSLIVQLAGIDVSGPSGSVALEPTVKAFDLARLSGDRGALVYSGPAPAGDYDHVTFRVASAIGTLESGEVVELAGLPLAVPVNLTVAPDDTAGFTFDLQAHALDNATGYALQAVPDGSHLGMPRPDVPTDPVPVPAPRTTPPPRTTAPHPTPTPTKVPATPGPGRLTVWLVATGNTSEYAHINTTLSALRLRSASGNASLSLSDSSVDLAALANHPVMVANVSAAAGTYTGLDVKLTPATADLASGASSHVSAATLAYVHAVTVKTGNVTSVVLAVRIVHPANSTLSLDTSASKTYAGYPPKPVPAATRVHVYVTATGALADFNVLNLTVSSVRLVGAVNQTFATTHVVPLATLGNGTLMLLVDAVALPGNETMLQLNVTAAPGRLVAGGNATVPASVVTVPLAFTVKAHATTSVKVALAVTKSGTHYALSGDAAHSGVLAASPA